MELLRTGLASALSAASQFVVCAATGDYDDLPDLIERHRPHLVIADPFQRGKEGVIWIKDFTARFPQAKMLVASFSEEAIYAERALRAGASGYWVKSGTAADLLKA